MELSLWYFSSISLLKNLNRKTKETGILMVAEVIELTKNRATKQFKVTFQNTVSSFIARNSVRYSSAMNLSKWNYYSI